MAQADLGRMEQQRTGEDWERQKIADSNKLHAWTIKDYCTKIIHISQMDIEYTFAQIFYSLTSPSKLYLLTKWRKRILLLSAVETKNYWARDDPCFLLVLMAFMVIVSISYALLHGKYFKKNVNITIAF
jgi:hypothetical protein